MELFRRCRMHRMDYRKRLRRTFSGAPRWTHALSFPLRLLSVTSGEIQRERTAEQGIFWKVLEPCTDLRDCHR